MTAFEGMCFGFLGGVVTTLICALTGAYIIERRRDDKQEGRMDEDPGMR